MLRSRMVSSRLTHRSTVSPARCTCPWHLTGYAAAGLLDDPLGDLVALVEMIR